MTSSAPVACRLYYNGVVTAYTIFRVLAYHPAGLLSDDRLRQYCKYHNIEIVGAYWEDYSAKTFDRPEFNQFVTHIKNHRNTAELLLFLKWDRFSRNIAEAYAMINRLTRLGIEPQAIEQPLDHSIPESNPVYCGKIFIPAYKNEDVMVVKAKHEPLVSEALFDEVQEALSGRKRKRPVKNSLKEELPLRGYLQCARCGSKLTGSASKGNGGRYFYYHCSKGCHERFKAEDANEEFMKLLKKHEVNANSVELYHEVLRDHNNLSEKDKARNLLPLKEEIKKCKSRMTNARQLMLDAQLDPKNTGRSGRNMKER